MEKEVTIVVPDAAGEDGLTRACKRGELFRNNSEIDKYYREGYIIHHYTIVDVEKGRDDETPQTRVKVYMEK